MSISQFLSGKVDLSDEQLDRLLSCMGYRLEVTWRPVVPDLNRSERRSWRLHCRLSIRLTSACRNGARPSSATLSGSAAASPASRTVATSTAGACWSIKVTCSACTVS
jgi:hypothetical protein